MKNTQFRDEPSMEEALASIRQIINNDIQDQAKEPRLASVKSADASSEKKNDVQWPTRDEVLELTELVLPDGTTQSLKRTTHTQDTPHSTSPSGSKKDTSEENADSWLSPETIAASAAAIASLSSLVKEPVSSETIAGSKTVDQLMQELLRPMLREWLDNHLPGIVRSVVREQIEKVMQHQSGS